MNSPLALLRDPPAVAGGKAGRGMAGWDAGPAGPGVCGAGELGLPGVLGRGGWAGASGDAGGAPGVGESTHVGTNPRLEPGFLPEVPTIFSFQSSECQA